MKRSPADLAIAGALTVGAFVWWRIASRRAAALRVLADDADREVASAVAAAAAAELEAERLRKLAQTG